MYSLSTCWNSQRHTDGREMLREIRDLGFEYAELSHGIRISLLPGVFEAVDTGEIRISSVHNFCPLPMGVTKAAPNVYQCSSRHSREVELTFRHTLKTLETAERVKAQAVVLHLGSVEMRNYTERLVEMVERGQREEAKYHQLCLDADKKREAKKGPYFERSLQFVEKLVPEAEKRGLKLGIENRQALEELPFDSDFPAVFKRITSDSVVYWHDCGHAQIKENLGFISHVLHLDSLQQQLGGLHVHDVKFPGDDHKIPGDGTVEFSALKPFLQPGHIKVLELSSRASAEDVLRGLGFLRECWGAG